VDEEVSVRDLAATVIDLAGVRAAMPGETLARFWRNPEAVQDEPLYAEVSGRTFRPDSYPVSHGDMQSVIEHDQHYIRRGDGVAEMYDVRKDPWERKDLVEERPVLADSLAARIEGIRGRSR
jgi:arylsulfatase A-like enzyme